MLECVPCSSFCKSHPKYKEMSRKDLLVHLQVESNFEAYTKDLDEWESNRREGKRFRHNSNSVEAETKNSLTTRQLKGYLWTKELLQKHGEESLWKKSKATTIVHMNKPISGMLRDKWILGAIDVYEDSSHSAVRRHDVCSGDDKADADAAWNALSNQALGNKDHGLAGFERMPLRIFSIGRLGSYTVMTTIYIIYNIYVVLLYYIYII